MSNVKRYHFDVRKVTKPETVKGGAIEPRTYFEVFTKVRDGREEAEELATKLADYERLRDALEKAVPQIKYVMKAFSCPCGARPENLYAYPHVTGCGFEAIMDFTPAAGRLEEAVAPKAARKEKASD